MSERRLSPVWTFGDGHLLGGHRLLGRHRERFDTQRERLDETGRDVHTEGAVVAVHSEYLVTGMTTFIVNNDGIVYQLYNPDPSLASHR
jgi:hypothetical protein